MLPLELSTDICSLRPHVDRLVLSCIMEIDHRGEIVGYELCEGVIRSAERMTYTEVNAILEGDAGHARAYARWSRCSNSCATLQQILNRKRERRGSIDFDLPEPVIEFDEFGLMKSITRSERNIAHRLIEEFMLSANECVAHHLEYHRIASALPHPREARRQTRLRFRNHRRHIRLFARRRRAAHPARPDQSRPPRRLRHRQARPRNRDPERSPHHPAHVPEAHGENRRQARRTNPQLPDAALA